MLCEMRTMSCGTTRPAPRFRCPTSLLPIWPAGSPTARPEASSRVCGVRPQRRCHVGVAPSSMALPSRPGRNPQPSSTISTTGVRAARVLFILKGMQVSQVLRALPVVLGLARPLSAQADLRVKTEGEWFYQEPDGRRLARLARGAVVTEGGGGAGGGGGGGSGEARRDWVQVTLEGWIFGGSVGPTERPGFDLAVTRALDENLRAVPLSTGTLVARLNRGFALNRIGDSGRWVHVRRSGWMKRAALEPTATVASPGPASRSDTGHGGSTTGVRPGGGRTQHLPALSTLPARSPRAAPRCTARLRGRRPGRSRRRRRCACW